MKIVGNIRDYYDSAIGAFGPSNTPLYNRIQKVELLENFSRHTLGRFMFQPKNTYMGRQTYHKQVLIGACGKIWIFAENTILKDAGPILDVSKSAPDIQAFLDEARASRTREYIRERMDASDILERNGIGAFDPINDEQAFIDLQTPIFAYLPPPPRDVPQRLTLGIKNVDHSQYKRTHGILIINPVLKDFDFQKYMDPYTIYQELEMFLGNVLTNNTTPKMPVGSDKVIAESKGFNKWSFRTPPSES